MRLCQIVPSLQELHGGPSKSAYALSQALGGLGHEVQLLATDPKTAMRAETGTLTTHVFRRGRPEFICPSADLRRHLRTVAADIVHHHSIWLRTVHYAQSHAARRRVPFVLSPRGMMSPWAWQHHRLRKAIVRQVIHHGAFEAAAGWHATSAEEAADIQQLGFRQPVCVAPNGVEAPSETVRANAAEFWRTTCPSITHHKTALFYSRFHQKKRVLELIDVWLEEAPPDWVLLVVGLPDDYTAPQLESYILRSSGVGRVHVYDGEGRPPPYSAASLFLLPSHSENFGMAIAEAMANGLPVVVTDTTPWAELNRNGTGWCVGWYDYREALRAALNESDDQRRSRGERAREYVLREYSWQQSAAKLVTFYRQLLGLNG